MNRLLASSMLLVMACTTVHTGRELKSSEVDLPKCEPPDLIVTATPADYPNVLLEVAEERVCTTETRETWAVHQEMHVSPYVVDVLGGAIGAAVGIGALVALQKSYNPQESLAYRGDASIILPFVGAAAGLALLRAAGPPNLTQTLAVENETETHVEQTPRSGSASNGTLELGKGEAISSLRGGQAYVPLAEAARAVTEGVLLDGRPIGWSMRNAGQWRPEVLPQCDRSAEVAGRKMDRATAEELSAATLDAVSCARAGWPFADQLTHKLDRICARRFGAACDAKPK